jgi:hypothetical protein
MPAFAGTGDPAKHRVAVACAPVVCPGGPHSDDEPMDTVATGLASRVSVDCIFDVLLINGWDADDETGAAHYPERRQ